MSSLIMSDHGQEHLLVEGWVKNLVQQLQTHWVKDLYFRWIPHDVESPSIECFQIYQKRLGLKIFGKEMVYIPYSTCSYRSIDIIIDNPTIIAALKVTMQGIPTPEGWTITLHLTPSDGVTFLRRKLQGWLLPDGPKP